MLTDLQYKHRIWSDFINYFTEQDYTQICDSRGGNLRIIL